VGLTFFVKDDNIKICDCASFKYALQDMPCIVPDGTLVPKNNNII